MQKFEICFHLVFLHFVGIRKCSWISGQEEDTGVDENIELLAQLDELIAMIPGVLPVGLQAGETGVAVSLLQTYLIFESEGPSRNALANASATGYFGPITTAAVREYQANNKLDETGVFDAQTKKDMD